jgi:hypothetical protein
MTTDPAAAPSFARTPAHAPEPVPSATRLAVPLLIGALVAVTLGVYGRVHDPTGIAVSVAGFSGPQTVKVWLATAAVSFAVVQLVTALMMWGKLPGPAWVGGLHRWSGRIAFLLTIPVAVHCLYALGFATYDLRTVTHSLLGCAFFGAFTTKMIILPRRGVPGWALPLVGGLVFAGLVGIWLTSALWFFTTIGVKL